MRERIAGVLHKARGKALMELSYAAHTVGKWYARRRSHVEPDASARDQADHLARFGYLVIPPDDRVRAFVRSHYHGGMAAAWDRQDGTWRDPPAGATYKLFLSDVCERWPDVLDLLDGTAASMLRAYYGAHFRYSYVEPYRTYPADGELPKSWLWHYDAVAPGVLKLMVYLNGAGAETGALRVLDHAQSAQLEQSGFRNRADSSRLAAEFERRQVVLEGEPGCAVIIDNRVLHKATAPARGHRDVVCFQILPSTQPEKAMRERHRVSRSYRPDTPQFPFLPTST